MANVTFLGTGLIGSGLAEAAAKRGDRVTAWNRSLDKARSLEAHGVRIASTAEDAVRGADRVHLALSEDAAVDAVLAACERALGAALVVDHSTTAPAGTAARATRLAARGVRFLHMPVFMSPAMCREAGGIMLCAGPRALFDAAEPELAKMTGRILFLGERPDLAAANKLFGNAMIFAITAGLSDVFTMAASLGISAEDARALFSVFDPSRTLAYRGASMAKGDYRPSFELVMARKDARLMMEAAGELPLAVLPAIAARMDALVARGHGGDDLGVLAVDAVAPRR